MLTEYFESLPKPSEDQYNEQHTAKHFLASQTFTGTFPRISECHLRLETLMKVLQIFLENFEVIYNTKHTAACPKKQYLEKNLK